MSKMHIQAMVCGLALTVMGTVSAAGSINVREEITVGTTAEEAWALVRNYCDIAAWHPAVVYCDLDGSDSTQVGTMRTLTLGNGAQLFERLDDYDVRGMSYSYSIPDAKGVLPVHNYSSTISVRSAGYGRAQVIWTGSFDPEGDADAAMEAITGVYQGGLAMIRDQAESMK